MARKVHSYTLMVLDGLNILLQVHGENISAVRAQIEREAFNRGIATASKRVQYVTVRLLQHFKAGNRYSDMDVQRGVSRSYVSASINVAEARLMFDAGKLVLNEEDCRGNTLAKRRKALKLSVIRVASMLGQDTAIIDGIERCEWTLQAHVTQYERLLQDFERGEYH